MQSGATGRRHENVAQRFTHVAIGSGDYLFAEDATRLAALGVWVTIVSRQGSLSQRLAMAACEVIFLDTVDTVDTVAEVA